MVGYKKMPLRNFSSAAFFTKKHIDNHLCVAYNINIDDYLCEVFCMCEIDVALICKALSDSNRLKIVKMLSSGKKCGCKLLEAFEITQPTLSHHMKILEECGLVKGEKQGKWTHYSLCCETLKEFKAFIASLACKNGGDCECQ